MDYQNIQFEVQQGCIGLLSINRPQVMNALNRATFAELEHLLKHVAEEPSIRSLIVTGAGRAFVAGADLSEIKEDGIEENRVYAKLGQDLMDRLEALPIPTVAAVNGHALGGGCELSLACDIRIATERAKFGMPEVGLGVIPCFGGTQRLAHLVGSGVAKELIFTGRTVTAQEALAMGLVNRVVPQGELIDCAMELLARMNTKSGSAIGYAKLAINHSRDMSLRDGLEFERELSAICYGLPDKTEGMRAFLEKRAPIYPAPQKNT